LCISEIQELGFINPSLQFVNCRDTCVPVIVNRKVDTTVLLFSVQFQVSKILVSEAGSVRYRRYVSNVKRQKPCKPSANYIFKFYRNRCAAVWLTSMT